MTEQQTLTQMDAAIASPWRDGTAATAISALLFDKVVTRALHNAPVSTQDIRNFGPIPFINGTVDFLQMQEIHYDALVLALGDEDTLLAIDTLAAVARVAMGREK